MKLKSSVLIAFLMFLLAACQMPPIVKGSAFQKIPSTETTEQQSLLFVELVDDHIYMFDYQKASPCINVILILSRDGQPSLKVSPEDSSNCYTGLSTEYKRNWKLKFNITRYEDFMITDMYLYDGATGQYMSLDGKSVW